MANNFNRVYPSFGLTRVIRPKGYIKLSYLTSANTWIITWVLWINADVCVFLFIVVRVRDHTSPVGRDPDLILLVRFYGDTKVKQKLLSFQLSKQMKSLERQIFVPCFLLKKSERDSFKNEAADRRASAATRFLPPRGEREVSTSPGTPDGSFMTRDNTV